MVPLSAVDHVFKDATLYDMGDDMAVETPAAELFTALKYFLEPLLYFDKLFLVL